jgi:hypothetical protein
MVASLYPVKDNPITGIIADFIDNTVGETLCSVSTEMGKPIDMFQLKRCESIGFLFFKDESIGYFFVIQEMLQIVLWDEYDEVEFKKIASEVVTDNINLHKQRIIKSNAHKSAKQKRVSIIN